MAGRYDDRYEATPYDVLKALRLRSPDPFEIDQRPSTREMISWAVAEDVGLKGPTGRVLKLNKLWELLDTMAAEGHLVAKTCAEWHAVGRWRPSRSKSLLYPPPEK